MGYSPSGLKEMDTTEHTHACACTHTHTHTVTLWLTFLGTYELFSKAVAPFYIPITNVLI